MIIPKNEAEAKRLEALVERNTKAEDWVSDDPIFSPLSSETASVDTVLNQVGDRKLPK